MTTVSNENKQKIKRAVLWKRLGVVREMLEWWPDMNEDTKMWMMKERDKLIAILEAENTDAS